MKISKEQLKQIVREELKNLSEKEVSLSGKEVANRIKNSNDKGHKMFFGKKALEAIAKKSKLTAKELDHMLPDYIPGNLIHGLFNENVNEYIDINLLLEKRCKPNRKSPCDSATLFKTGDIKIGEDGNYWKIVIYGQGEKRWQKIKNKNDVDKKRIIKEMRPSVAKDLPGETIWDHISDHYDWEDYLGKGGMKELEKSLKKMKRVKPQQLDQMLPGYIPADEVYDIFRNSLAIGPTE